MVDAQRDSILQTKFYTMPELSESSFHEYIYESYIHNPRLIVIIYKNCF